MIITNVQLYQAVVLKHGLLLFAKTGMKPNKAWTPTAMLKLASHITGKKFKRGQYVQAADAVEAYLTNAQAEGQTL